MSANDHDAPDESGINRAWLSGGLILAALALAGIPSWSKAAPHSRQAPPQARGGVIILQDHSVKDGAVLVRGPSITLIQKRGELVLPREEVLLFDVDFDRAQRPKGVVVLADEAGSVREGHVLKRGDTVWLLRGNKADAYEVGALRWIQESDTKLSADYWKSYPAEGRNRVKTSGPRAGDQGDRIGCLVQTSGAVLVGRMESSEESIRVLTSDGVTTVVPRTAVRWHAMGVTEPTADYWATYPQMAIDPRYESSRPVGSAEPVDTPATSTQRWAAAARRDPQIAAALMATTQHRWVDSADLWLGLFAQRGKTPFFQNYEADARKAIREASSSFRREVLLARVDRLLADARKHKVFDREEVKEFLAGCIREAARKVWAKGFRKSAHDLVDRMSSLSPEYEREAGAFWGELRKVPSRFNFEGQ